LAREVDRRGVPPDAPSQAQMGVNRGLPPQPETLPELASYGRLPLTGHTARFVGGVNEMARDMLRGPRSRNFAALFASPRGSGSGGAVQQPHDDGSRAGASVEVLSVKPSAFSLRTGARGGSRRVEGRSWVVGARRETVRELKG
jgi:hypothetical protein